MEGYNYYCECGASIVYRTKFGDSLDIHRETEKHMNMLVLKKRDPESWKLRWTQRPLW